MSLDKNILLVTNPCSIMLSSISDNAVTMTSPFSVSPSTITLRVSSRRDEHGLIYTQQLTASFAGLDPDTYNILSGYNRDDYAVRVQFDDGKIYTVATALNPMDFSTTSRNGDTSITLENSSLDMPRYDAALNESEIGLPLTLTFSLT